MKNSNEINLSDSIFRPIYEIETTHSDLYISTFLCIYTASSYGC